jgi:ribosomal protein S27E
LDLTPFILQFGSDPVYSIYLDLTPFILTPFIPSVYSKRHRPETTLLYQLVERYYPDFKETLSEQGKHLPTFVEREFDDFLRCGRLEHGFLRVDCGDCKHQKLVAFSCKRRGFCPSCGARRMAISAALLVDDVLHSP